MTRSRSINKPSKAPIGYTASITDHAIKININNKVGTVIKPGTEVEIQGRDNKPEAEALFHATVTTVEGSTAWASTTYSRVSPAWTTQAQEQTPHPVFLRKRAPKLPSNRQVEATPKAIFHGILTCQNCQHQQVAKVGTRADSANRARIMLDCPRCNRTTGTVGAARAKVLYRDLMTCAKCDRQPRVVRPHDSKECIYVCANCAIETGAGAQPILLVSPTDRFITRMAVSTVLQNLESIIEPAGAENRDVDEREEELISFLLSQINRRKQSLLAFSERPSFGYNDIRTRMEVLLDHQRYLEESYKDLTGENYDWAQSPTSLDYKGSRIFGNHIVEGITLSSEKAVVTYRNLMFTNASPHMPTNIETIDFFQYE